MFCWTRSSVMLGAGCCLLETGKKYCKCGIAPINEYIILLFSGSKRDRWKLLKLKRREGSGYGHVLDLIPLAGLPEMLSRFSCAHWSALHIVVIA